MKQKIVFFGTPEHSKTVLEKLYRNKDIEIVGVITNPDRPVGRKKILTPSPVKLFAEKNSLPVLTPENFSLDSKEGKDAEKWLQQKNAHFFIIVAYGTLIPQNIIDIPEQGTFNLHFSLLPQYRGASPVQSAILDNNAHTTGISLFQLVLEMDAGAVFLQEKIDISGKNFLESIDVMTHKGGVLCEKLSTQFEKFSGTEQKHNEATFCKKFTKADGEISLFGENADSAETILRKFLAFTPWPGIFFFDENQKRVKILNIKKYTGDVSPIEKYRKHPDTSQLFICEKKLLLQTSTGVLEIIELQKEGKKPISGNQYF